MLLVERKATIPSEKVMEQVRELVDKHLSKLFKKFGGRGFKSLYKLDDNIINKYDNWLIKHDDYEYIGNIIATDLETEQEVNINVFVFSSDKMTKHENAAYNEEAKQVYVSVNFLKSERRSIINKIAHEIIHGIQKFKSFKSYRYNPLQNDHENKFLYYTEMVEFDAQVGELMVNIEEYFRSFNEKGKFKILAVLKDFLKKNKNYNKNIDWDKINITLKELFYEYRDLIYYIVNPPILNVNDRNLDSSQIAERRYKNEKYQKVSNNRYLQFKQKLFNTYQKLVDEYKKIMKQR